MHKYLISRLRPIITISFLVIVVQLIAQPATPIFYNTSNNNIPVFFNNTRACNTPVFAISATNAGGYNTMQIEINDSANFSGTSYVQTYSGTYGTGVKTDFYCNNTTPAFPAPVAAEKVFYVRARASANGGGTWSAWTSATWSFTYSTDDFGFQQKTGPQFNTGTYRGIVGTNGVFIQSTSIGNTNDNIFMNRGSFNESVKAGADDGVYEGSWYSTQAYATIGYQSDCNGNRPIYNAFRFRDVVLPRGADILTSDITLRASTACFCENLNANIYVKIAGHNHGLATAPALSGAIVSTTTNRTAEEQLWLINTSWTNDNYYASPDISNILEYLISLGTWDPLDALTIFMDSYNSGTYTANRCIRTYESNPTHAARISGTFTNFDNYYFSPKIDANWFPCVSQFETLEFTKDETYGSVSVSVYYDVAGTPTLIPDAVLPGNSTGLNSPANISAINLTTYPSIYLGATLKYTSVNTGESPKLFDWKITANPSPTVNAGQNDTICEGDATTITATGCGNYLWSTGETTATITVSPAITTTYTVTASTGNCFQQTDEVTVHVFSTGLVNISPDTTICTGGFATLTASGGSTYSWSTGANTPGVVVSPASTTTYTVTVSNFGCTASGSVTVTVQSAPNVTITGNTSVCQGSGTTLTGNGASSYTWSTGETTNAITVNPATNTTYTVVGDVGGCTGSASVNVTVNALPNVSAGANTSICTGDVTSLTASGATSYSWNTGDNTATISVSPAVTTTYTVTGTSSGCTASASVTVTVTSNPHANAGQDVTICQGQSTTLFATGGQNFSWSTGQNTQSINVTPSVTTTYTVTVSTGSCSGTDAVTVTVNPIPNANAGPDQTICAGQSVTLTASGGNNFYWSTGQSQQTIIVTPNTTSTYTVSVVSNGCSATDAVVVTVNPLPNASAGNNVSICSGQSTNLIATGGSAYMWNTGSGNQTITVNPTSTTSYTVTVTQNACTASSMVLVTVYPVPSVSAGANQEICNGSTAHLTAIGGSSYIWSNGQNSQSISVNPTTTTTYYVTATDANGCTGSAAVTVSVLYLPTVAVTPIDTVCDGETFVVSGTSVIGADSMRWRTTGTGVFTGSHLPNPFYKPSVQDSLKGYVNLIFTAYNRCGSVSDTLYLFIRRLPVADAGPGYLLCGIKPHLLLKSEAQHYDSVKWETNGAGYFLDPYAPYTYYIPDSTDAGAGPIMFILSAYSVCGLDIDTTYANVFFEFEISVMNDVTEAQAGAELVLEVSEAHTYHWFPEIFVSCIHCQYPSVWPDTNSIYVVIAHDIHGCQATDSIRVEVIYGDNIFVPNAFSPNYDGVNDILYVRGNGIEHMMFQIFDRWGNKVFQSEHPRYGWDGTYKGLELSSGVFGYNLFVTLYGGTRIQKRGNITLIR